MEETNQKYRNTEIQKQNKFALGQKFSAAMFDFDGTVTERGHYEPPKEMVEALIELSDKMPIAFCTGRQLESFEKNGLSSLLEGMNKEAQRKFQKNLCLIAENGAVGYAYNTSTDSYEEFYRAEWPEEFIKKEELSAVLSHEIAHYGDMLDSGHRVVLVMRTNLYDGDHTNVEAVSALSEQIYMVCKRVLTEFDPNYEKHLHVGNSGIGVLICPADNDKDEGVRRFGEYLKEKRGMTFNNQFTEILVVGDSPQEGGNDRYFLSGRYGTPFTVGDLNPELPRLQAVSDEDGNRIMNAKGTLHLVRTKLL